MLKGNGTAFDKKTGLTWMRCALGQAWQSTAKTCSGSTNTYIWQDALNAAETASFAGVDDWRLPNVKELRSIVERRCIDPAVNLTVFPGALSTWFWSSSPIAHYSYGAWTISFNDGYDGSAGYKHDRFAVRLVRGGR